jgi:hypothetical protein
MSNLPSCYVQIGDYGHVLSGPTWTVSRARLAISFSATFVSRARFCNSLSYAPCVKTNQNINYAFSQMHCAYLGATPHSCDQVGRGPFRQVEECALVGNSTPGSHMCFIWSNTTRLRFHANAQHFGEKVLLWPGGRRPSPCSVPK